MKGLKVHDPDYGIDPKDGGESGNVSSTNYRFHIAKREDT